MRSSTGQHEPVRRGLQKPKFSGEKCCESSMPSRLMRAAEKASAMDSTCGATESGCCLRVSGCVLVSFDFLPRQFAQAPPMNEFASEA